MTLLQEANYRWECTECKNILYGTVDEDTLYGNYDWPPCEVCGGAMKGEPIRHTDSYDKDHPFRK